MTPDPYNIQRFLDAQHRIYGQVRDELIGGQKETHWIWSILRRSSRSGFLPSLDNGGPEARLRSASRILRSDLPRIRRHIHVANVTAAPSKTSFAIQITSNSTPA